VEIMAIERERIAEICDMLEEERIGSAARLSKQQ